MKKMLSVALAAALVLGIAGCGGAGTPETAATEAATTATEAAKESETAAAGFHGGSEGSGTVCGRQEGGDDHGAALGGQGSDGQHLRGL